MTAEAVQRLSSDLAISSFSDLVACSPQRIAEIENLLHVSSSSARDDSKTLRRHTKGTQSEFVRALRGLPAFSISVELKESPAPVDSLSSSPSPPLQFKRHSQSKVELTITRTRGSAEGSVPSTKGTIGARPAQWWVVVSFGKNSSELSALKRIGSISKSLQTSLTLSPPDDVIDGDWLTVQLICDSMRGVEQTLRVPVKIVN